MDLFKLIAAKIASFPSKEDAAKFFGIAHGTLAKYMSGNANLSVAAIQKLLDALIAEGRLKYDQPAIQPAPPVADTKPVENVEEDEEDPEKTEEAARPSSVKDAVAIIVSEAATMGTDDLKKVIEASSRVIRAQIALCVPTARNGTVTGMNLLALAGNSRNFRCGQLKVEIGNNLEDAMNKLAAKVIEDKHIEWAFFMHPDIFVPFGNAGWFRRVTNSPYANEFLGMNALERMCSNRENRIVGAVYGCPQDNERFAIQPDLEPKEDDDKTLVEMLRQRGPQNKLRDVSWIATGVMAVHRSAFEKIIELAPEDIKPKPGVIAPSLEQFGGDKRFCKMAKAAGIGCKLDLAVHAVPWNRRPVIVHEAKV
jgi:transcriptional regulator with XRE-family HTH domain